MPLNIVYQSCKITQSRYTTSVLYDVSVVDKCIRIPYEAAQRVRVYWGIACFRVGISHSQSSMCEV